VRDRTRDYAQHQFGRGLIDSDAGQEMMTTGAEYGKPASFGTGLTTSAWILRRGDTAAEIGPLRLETVELPAPGPHDVLVEPLYGSWEGNMDHAVRRSPVDVCELRGENRVVLGNAGVVRVLGVGSAVTNIAPDEFGIVFCNGVSDTYGYPITIFGYDTPGTIGVLAAKTVLHETNIIPIPLSSPLSMQQWAAFSLRYITAWANWRVAWGCFRVQMPDIDPKDIHVWAWGGGVALAELSLARGAGCRVAMMASRPERIAELRDLGIDAIDRSAFRAERLEEDFLATVRERTNGQGISILIDNIGAHPTANLKALARQGVIATSGWKHRTNFPLSRATECQNRHLHIFTHYAHYDEGCAAVDYALHHGWGPPVPTQTYDWTEIPQLAADYAAGRIASYFPIFRVNAQRG
jgi:NADPH:quinone reductase-like Zn-dependent oxidoreductase